MNVYQHNQLAWDHEAESRGRWSIPVSPEAIAAAKQGIWEIYLTPQTPVPREWFPELAGCELLCLATAGGQQAPILAAAGANVTVLDCSEGQMRQDRLVAEQHALPLRTVQGDMADLHMFADKSFDLIVNACSNCFVPDVLPVWKEAFRVLRPGGLLLAGFFNPVYFLCDRVRDDEGVLDICHTLPFSDLTSIDEKRRQTKIEDKMALEFGHTLTQQIGGQLAAGFFITGFFEDYWSDKATNLNRYTPVYIVTRALRPSGS